MSSNSHVIDVIDLSSDDDGEDKVNMSSDSDIVILEQDSGLCLEEGEDGEEGDQETEVPVVVQDGPLTLTLLVSEVRTAIKKRKLENEEVLVDDFDQEQDKKKRVTGVKWTGESVRTVDERTFHEEVTLKLGSREKKVVPGQYLLFNT